MVYTFLSALKVNNNREWFEANKTQYEQAKEGAELVFNEIFKELDKIDEFGKFKMYRIYRDVRFSKDKTPYKNHFGAIFMRKQPHNRGSFYVHLEPGNTFVGGGFWRPEKDDLARIREEIALDDELTMILNEPRLKKEFGTFKGEALKTAPKGFDKEHPRIELLRMKQFLLTKSLSDELVFTPSFVERVVESYTVLQPFFMYMTDVLTTNSDGESIL